MYVLPSPCRGRVVPCHRRSIATIFISLAYGSSSDRRSSAASLSALVERHAETHERDDAVGGAAALRHFAAPGARRGAPAVVSVVSRADDRRIAQAPRVFPRPARRADPAGDVAGRSRAITLTVPCGGSGNCGSLVARRRFGAFVWHTPFRGCDGPVRCSQIARASSVSNASAQAQFVRRSDRHRRPRSRRAAALHHALARSIASW